MCDTPKHLLLLKSTPRMYVCTISIKICILTLNSYYLTNSLTLSKGKNLKHFHHNSLY